MKLFLQLFLLFFTWFNLSATTAFSKFAFPSYSLSFPKSNNQKIESEVKIGVCNFARSGIYENSISQKVVLWESSVLENRAREGNVNVVRGAGSLAQSLTGALKSSYNKLIASGLNAVEEANVIKLFNTENKLVAEIANSKLVFKYSGYSGDIAMVEGKSTAVFGRFNDPIHGGGTKEFIQNPNKVYETGANPNGINILNIQDWTWPKNETWVIESANRGDIIRFISDPTSPSNIFKNGINGERTVTGLEIQTLETLGFVWNPNKFQYIKP